MIHDQDVQAEPHSGSLIGVLTRLAWVTGCGLGLAFLIALLAPGSGTAHASDEPAPIGTTAEVTAAAVPLVGDSSATQQTLWADPATLSATANRRASAEVGWASPRQAARESAPERPSEPSGPVEVSVARSVMALSTPLGSLGPSGGTPDAGPSPAQLAVLTAALAVGLWMTQRVLAKELAWRSALIISIVERPG